MCILTDEVDAWNDMDWQHALFSVAPLLCSKQTMRLWIIMLTNLFGKGLGNMLARRGLSVSLLLPRIRSRPPKYWRNLGSLPSPLY
jgi:hypothetical protein